MINVEMHILFESFLHPFMDACDQTERGKKVFCETKDGGFNITNLCYEIEHDRMLASVTTSLNSEGLNPVFALVKADNGFIGVYWRPNINQISTGRSWWLYYKFVELFLSGYNPYLVLNENVTISQIQITVNGEKVILENLRTI